MMLLQKFDTTFFWDTVYMTIDNDCRPILASLVSLIWIHRPSRWVRDETVVPYVSRPRHRDRDHNHACDIQFIYDFVAWAESFARRFRIPCGSTCVGRVWVTISLLWWQVSNIYDILPWVIGQLPHLDRQTFNWSRSIYAYLCTAARYNAVDDSTPYQSTASTVFT